MAHPVLQLRRPGITAKLFLAVLVLNLLVVAAMAAAARISFERGFLGYLREQEVRRMESFLPPLQAAYRQHGNWQFLKGDPRDWIALLRPAQTGVTPDGQPLYAPPISDLTGANMRFTLVDADGSYVFGRPDPSAQSLRSPVMVDGKVVGWLLMLPFQQATEVGDLRFREGQVHASWTIALIAALAVAVISLWLARALAAPLRQLAGAIHHLVSGDYAVRVPVASGGDIGQLQRDFNRLADTLERNERMRREFVADVSHELRTPLAIMRGELEALEDGVRPLDAPAVLSLQGEVRMLSKLVDDLYDLSLADIGALRYRRSELDLHELLERVLDSFGERLARAGLDLQSDWPGGPLLIDGDESRLQQVFANVVENSARYTEAGGVLRVRCRHAGAMVAIDFMDSAPGVPEALLGNLFERFYRLEGSRNRASGGAGLGLPICRSIVQAHGGSIEARMSPLGGLWIAIRLPRREGMA